MLCIGNIESGELKIADMNAMRKIRYSTPVVSVIRSSAYEQKIDISTIPTDKLSQKLASIHGYMADAFAVNGDATAMILADLRGTRAGRQRPRKAVFGYCGHYGEVDEGNSVLASGYR